MIVVAKIIFSNATIKTTPILFISIVVERPNHVTSFPPYKEGIYYQYFPSRSKGPTRNVPMQQP
jgi:hypothetical protein